MKKISLDGFDLAYDRRGSGPPLVLIHGFPLDHSIWDDVVPLLENDFDAILPDPIPMKGAVLTAVADFWFAKLADSGNVFSVGNTLRQVGRRFLRFVEH